MAAWPRAARSASLAFTLAASVGMVGTLAGSRAAASSCVEQPAEQLIDAADVIFEGQAVSIDGERATTFRVTRVYKGSVPSRVLIETDGVKYAMLEPPHAYLVFATRRTEGSRVRLFNGTCGGSTRAPFPDALVQRLRKGAPQLTTPSASAAPPPPATASAVPSASAAPSSAPSTGPSAASNASAAPTTTTTAGPRIEPSPRVRSGCASCSAFSSSSGNGDWGALGAAVFLAILLGVRRRRRPDCV